jgi:hypothetical protein
MAYNPYDWASQYGPGQGSNYGNSSYQTPGVRPTNNGSGGFDPNAGGSFRQRQQQQGGYTTQGKNLTNYEDGSSTYTPHLPAGAPISWPNAPAGATKYEDGSWSYSPHLGAGGGGSGGNYGGQPASSDFQNSDGSWHNNPRYGQDNSDVGRGGGYHAPNGTQPGAPNPYNPSAWTAPNGAPSFNQYQLPGAGNAAWCNCS